ncbi:MAG TPA: DUF4435 domain-containing protein [Ktedonosporobacter sp.]|jgi:hypothetical protein|nr:DUF4435 domain-containing protein [Ktedonosporobacter sp.]
MREYITEHEIANTIRLIRAQRIGACLIVEGDTDGRAYKNFVDENKCQIIIAHNKDNATKALSLLESDNFAGVLAIVDADFDVLEGKVPASENLLFTDGHDLEAMIIQSPALEKVLAEFGSESKIANFEKKMGKSVRLILTECGMPVGYLLWVSLREKLSLRFEDLDFDKFIDKETLVVDTGKLVRLVQSRSSQSGSNRPPLDDEIHNKIRALKDDSHDPWHVCCGHDLVCILSLGLRKAFGTVSEKPENIEKWLRLAYDSSHFCCTRLYASLQQWEKAHVPFVLLKSSNSQN